MKVAIKTLASILNENVAEIKFQRRNQKDNSPVNRRMLCTTSSAILNSAEGRSLLKYNPPKGKGVPFSPLAKNLLIVWDIMKRDFRAVPMDNCELVSTLKVDEFWPYYKTKLAPMNEGAIQTFYNA